MSGRCLGGAWGCLSDFGYCVGRYGVDPLDKSPLWIIPISCVIFSQWPRRSLRGYGKRPYFSTFVVVAPFPFHEFLCPLNSFSCFNAFVKFDYPSFLTDSCEKLYPPKTFSSFRVSSGKNNISGVLGEWGTL